MLLREFQRSRADLLAALAGAEESKYFEEVVAAKTALAELAYRTGGELPKIDLLIPDEIQERARVSGYAMLVADFSITLAKIHRSLGNTKQAISNAKCAMDAACGDEGAFRYNWGFTQARRQLIELGQYSPERLNEGPLDGAQHDPQNETLMDARQLTKAQMRADFTELLRTISGSYRYAPAKYSKLLNCWII